MAAVTGVVGVLLLILLAVAVISAVLAVRHRLAFRIGMRNVRRAKGRTVLLLLGLLVATTIISGSLVVGDTVNQLSIHYTLLGVGYNDEIIGNMSPSGSYVPFPYTVYSAVANSTAGDSQIAGSAPMIVGTIQAYDRTSGVPQTNLNLVGVNGNQSAQLGSFTTDGGQKLAGPAPGEVVLDDLAASEMNATTGDRIVLYGAGAAPMASTVQAVVRDDIRGSFPTGGVGAFGSVFVALSTAQQLENISGMINVISVTNTGSQLAGITLSDSVSSTLNATLAKIPAAAGLKVAETLQVAVAGAESSGSGITTLFLALGLFSIVAGAMLIIGIFVLLSEERKGEMGMLRAVGLRRRELIYVYFFEGLAYSAGSAAAGTLLGVGAGYGLTYAFSTLLSGQGLSQSAILESFTVLPQTLLIAYVAGFLLTLITVILASRRASRLNIVRAIRDLPEPPPTIRTYTVLAYLGVAAVVLGGLLLATTIRGTSDISYPTIGGALMILGAALIASRFVKNRYAFTAAGLAFLVWAGFEPLHPFLFGSAHTGGIFIVFVEGIIMVGGALLIYAFNSAPIVRRLLAALEGRNGRAPVARVALSYPGRRPARTTVSLAIFALVVFTMVAIATFGSTVQANLDNVVQQQSGGYTFFGISTTPLPNLPGQIASNATLAPEFSTVVPVLYGGIDVNVSGWGANPWADSIYSAPSAAAPSSNFYDTNQFTFVSTWHGMSRSTVMDQLATNASVAIVDNTYTPSTSLGSSPAPHPFVSAGDSILLVNPATGNHTTVVVIGILSESVVTGVWVSPTTASALGINEARGFLLTAAPGASATRAEQNLKSAFFPYGLVVFDIGALLASSIDTEEGFIGLLEIFVGLGLAVGIAAMGIVAVRAVVERKREIGMLRANGFTQRMILKAFLLEYSAVTLLGIAIGTALGLLIVYDLSLSPSAATAGVTTFAVPYWNLFLILVVAYGLAMAAVAEPSLRAARLPPAEAVRPTE